MGSVTFSAGAGVYGGWKYKDVRTDSVYLERMPHEGVGFF